MKRLIVVLLVVCEMAVCGWAQSNTLTSTQAADMIVSNVENGASNFVFVVDGLYAPHATKDGQFGAEALAGVGMSQYVIIGLHAEYLNKLPTYGGGQLTLQLPFHPLAGYGNTSITATPWAYVGSGTSFGNGKAVTVVGETAAGLELTVWRSKHGYFHVGLNAGIGKRTDLSGEVYNGGIDAGCTL